MEESRTDTKEPYIQGCYTVSNDTELEYDKDKNILLYIIIYIVQYNTI